MVDDGLLEFLNASVNAVKTDDLVYVYQVRGISRVTRQVPVRIPDLPP